MEPDWLALFLAEDLGPAGVAGDLSAALVADGPCRAAFVVRSPCRVAGLSHAQKVFLRLGVDMDLKAADGDDVAAGPVATVAGPLRAVLAGERLALNIVARMSGIATATRDLQRRLADAGHGARVAATRKTTPGFRRFEKEAVALGGGDPHRAGLFDAIMLKDNHLVGLDVAAVVAMARQAHPGVEITVEVEDLQAARAATAADWVLIDNQPPEVGARWAAAIRAARPGVKVEASGGIRPETVTSYGFADRISLGWLTAGAPWIDVGLDREDP